VQLSAAAFQQFILPHLSMPKRGPRCKLGYHRVFNLILWVLYTGMQWKCLPVPQDADGTAKIHYTTIYKVFAKWSDDGSLQEDFRASVGHLAAHNQLDVSVLHGDGTNTVAKKGGDGLGYSGHKHQKGEKVIAIVDNNGYVLAPLPVAPVNEADTVLLPEGLKALKRLAKQTGLALTGSYLNLDGGFDSRHNRKAIFNAGLIPNIKENPRNRKHLKLGRKRLFNGAIHALRDRVERTLAWEDKFKRVLLRFEYIQQRHYGMKLMAYTLINLRQFCAT
jgi:transposase